MIEVKNLEELLAIQNPKDRELARVGDDKIYSYYCYIDGRWVDQGKPEISIQLYEANKQIWGSKDNMSQCDIAKNIKNYIYDVKAKYYMLLNNEFKYYTIFHTGNGEEYNSLNIELINLLNNFDNIKHIERVNNALEIWATLNGEFGLFMLFNYAEGVVECK